MLKRNYDPNLRVILSHGLLQELDLVKVNYKTIREKFIHERKPEVHLPRVPPRIINQLLTLGVEYKFDREKIDEKTGEYTDQFKEGKPIQEIFPTHQMNDQQTFNMAIKKRINRVKSPAENIEALTRTRAAGNIMFMNLISAIKLPQATHFDEVLFEECIRESEEKKMERNLTGLMNIIERNDPMWEDNFIDLFMKSQICKKLEKMYSEAKAGQTLACFNSKVLLALAPVGLYITKKIEETLPSNIFINSRKNDADLVNWVETNWESSRLSTCDDFESYDQSQDGTCVNLEIFLFDWLKIPRDLLNLYLHVKCHALTCVGFLELMRLTGEWATFLFNTLNNIAYHHTDKKIKDGTPQMYGGDDLTINDVPEKKNQDFIAKLKMKSKPEETMHPVFCGWYIHELGIVKSPTLIWARLQISIERGNLKDTINSYYTESMHGYRLGFHLHEVLNEEELVFQNALNNFFIKHKKMIDNFQAQRDHLMLVAERKKIFKRRKY